MQLDKENIKKIRWLIAFAILLYLGVQNLHMVISTARVLLGFLFPFIIGFGIAFILNIPMKFIEHHLFGKALKQEKKTAQKLARPVSHSKKDRRKYSGFPEMDRQCIRKQSGSCEMGAVS